MTKTIVHVGGCGHVAERPEYPPDYVPEPDRYGNTRGSATCKGCGERATTIWVKDERTHKVPAGFAFAEDVDYLVPLP